MKYIKAFIAGITLPAIVSPFLIAFFIISNETIAVEKLPFLYFGPILWGLWNILFIATRKRVDIRNRNVKIGVYGAVYGIFTSLINSLYFEFTSVIPSFSDAFILWAVIVYPIAMYFAWKYVVNALNLILEVY